MAERGKRKRVVLTVKQKIEILQRYEQGESVASLAEIYNTGRATIWDLKKKKQDLLDFASKLARGDVSQARKTLKNAKNTILDDVIHAWCMEQKNLGRYITGPLLRKMAMKFNTLLNGSDDFKASSGWLQNFKYRHGIELPINALPSKALPTNLFKDELFCNQWSTHDLDNLYTADETIINLYQGDVPFEMSSFGADALEVITQNKVTVLMCVNASGTHSLPLLVVKKPDDKKWGNDFASLPLIFKSQKDGLMTPELFADWYRYDFIPCVERQQMNSKPSKVILLLNNVSCHPSVETLNSMDGNFTVILFPSDFQQFLQPLKRSVISEVKRLYRIRLTERLLLTNDGGNNMTGLPKKLELSDCFCALASVWNSLTECVFKMEWEKFLDLLSKSEYDNSLADVSDDEDVSEFTKFLNHVPVCCYNEESNSRSDLNSKEQKHVILPSVNLDNEEKVPNIKTEPCDDDELMFDDSRINVGAIHSDSTSPTHSEALSALETSISWFKNQPEFRPFQMLVLKTLRDLAAEKKESSS